jgi:hypothetical protein
MGFVGRVVAISDLERSRTSTAALRAVISSSAKERSCNTLMVLTPLFAGSIRRDRPAKPFVKGEDTRRVHGRKDGQLSISGREFLKVLETAADAPASCFAQTPKRFTRKAPNLSPVRLAIFWGCPFFHSAFTPKRTRARINLIEHFCFPANSSIASDSRTPVFFIYDWVIFAVALQVEGAKVLVFEFLVVDVVVKAESRILKRSRNNLAGDFVAPFEQRRFSLRFLVGGEVSSLSFSTMARQRLSARVQWTSIASASTGSLLRQ